jgi:type IV secretory pathway component VirB8
MNKRWIWGGLVSYLSSYEVYQEFAEIYPRVQDELDQKEASRSVEILSVKRTGGERSRVWEVEFKTYDFAYEKKDTAHPNRKVGPIIEEKYWIVNIECRADPSRRTAYRRLLNPLGFVVQRYFQSEIEG